MTKIKNKEQEMYYKLKNNDIIKDGHTMFLQDVVADLNRKHFLESETAELKEGLKHVLQIMDDSVSVQDLHQFEDDRIKKAVELIGGW